MIQNCVVISAIYGANHAMRNNKIFAIHCNVVCFSGVGKKIHKYSKYDLNWLNN